MGSFSVTNKPFIKYGYSVAGILLFIYFVYNILKHTQNNIELKKILTKEVFHADIDEIMRMNEKERIKIIMRYLKTHISYTDLDRNMKRPVLRASAIDILKSGKGFCGENVRVSIRFLDFVKIPARRIYLFGPKWEHVLVECKIDTQWYLVDMHNDPSTIMDEEDIGIIKSPMIKLLKNENNINPWIDYQRIRFFHNKPILGNLRGIKLPHSLVYFFETPYLIKAALSAFFFILISLIKQKSQLKNTTAK